VHIEWAVTCRYAESDMTQATIIGAGSDVLVVPQIPGPVGTMLAVRLAAPAEELVDGVMHTVRGRVRDPQADPVVAPDGSPVPDLELEFGTQGGVQQLVPGWLVNPILAFGIQWWANETGSYSLELQVDDGDEHRHPIHVLDAQNMPQPG
jgi:hypothetical protein